MSRPSPQLSDPRILKPVVEALIFASEEPLPPRALVRLLVGERDDADPDDERDGGANARMDTPAGSVETPAEDVDTPAEDIATPAEDVRAPAEDVSAPAEQPGGTIDSSEVSDDVAVSDLAGEDVRDLVEAYADVQMHTSDDELGEIDTIDQRLVRRVVDVLNEEYEETGRAFRIVELAGGFQFATLREYGEYVALLSRERQRRRLSPAALETLSIIAYRQPIAKPEIEAIRGVNSDQVLLSLLEKNLIAITGRSETVGRPLLYGTTDDFLRCFGLNTLNDLPKLREIEELMEEDAYSAEKIDVVNVPESSEAAEIEALVGAAGTLVDERDLREAAATGRVPDLESQTSPASDGDLEATEPHRTDEANESETGDGAESEQHENREDR